MDASRETVLVLPTGQRAAQATARSLARAGFRVVGGWEGGRLNGRTRYCARLVLLPPPSRSDEFLAAVRDVCEQERIRAVVPLSDEHQVVLLRNPDALGGALLVGPSPEQFARLCDKAGLVATAERAGVDAPRTAIVEPGGTADLPPLPAFVKVVTSAYDGRPAGRPVRVTSAPELARALERVHEAGDTALVQEEVDAPHWRYYFARNGHGRLSLAARQVADHPGRVAQASVLAFEDVPPALEDANRRLLDAGGYDGAGSIQWIERDGDWLVHDANFRMPANVAGPIAAGLDLPALAVAHALGRSLGARGPRRRATRYVWLPGELTTLLSPSPTRGRRSRGRIVRTIVGAALSPAGRLGPLDVTDPLPTLAALAPVVRRR